jgi:iron complex outermembrane receptor protein
VDARGFVDLQYEHQRESGWGVLGRLSYDQYDYSGTYVYDSSVTDVPSRVLNKDFAYGKWWGGELNVLRTFRKKHHLVLGSKYRNDFQQDQGNFDFNPFTSYFNDHRNSKIWAAYLQGDVVLHHDLVLNLGLRYDRYTTFGGTTNPRAALIYSPRKNTTLKFLFAQAFRAPNAYELFYSGIGSEPSPHLRPETVRTGEVVVEKYLGKHYLATASAFGYWIRGLISQQTDPVSGLLSYRNTARATGKGMEFELRRKSSWGLEAGVSYSFMGVKDVPSGEPLINSPRHLGKLNFSTPLVRNKVFASLNLEYMSRRRTLSGAYAGGHAVPSLTLFSRDVLRGWEISASVYNFSNTKYGDPGAAEHREDVIYQDGRTFRLKVAYRF